MMPARYEVRVNGLLSERARSAFCSMDVVGELAGQFGLSELLALCRAMGLEVVSLQRLPADVPTGPGATHTG